MAQNQPLWLQLVHSLERKVGKPVEGFVRSDAYFDVLAGATRAGRRVRHATEAVTQEWLHLWNLPAGSDIRRVQEQLARLERRLAQLSKEVADRDEAGENGARPGPETPE